MQPVSISIWLGTNILGRKNIVPSLQNSLVSAAMLRIFFVAPKAVAGLAGPNPESMGFTMKSFEVGDLI